MVLPSLLLTSVTMVSVSQGTLEKFLTSVINTAKCSVKCRRGRPCHSRRRRVSASWQKHRSANQDQTICQASPSSNSNTNNNEHMPQPSIAINDAIIRPSTGSHDSLPEIENHVTLAIPSGRGSTEVLLQVQGSSPQFQGDAAANPSPQRRAAAAADSPTSSSAPPTSDLNSNAGTLFIYLSPPVMHSVAPAMEDQLPDEESGDAVASLRKGESGVSLRWKLYFLYMYISGYDERRYCVHLPNGFQIQSNLAKSYKIPPLT